MKFSLRVQRLGLVIRARMGFGTMPTESDALEGIILSPESANHAVSLIAPSVQPDQSLPIAWVLFKVDVVPSVALEARAGGGCIRVRVYDSQWSAVGARIRQLGVETEASYVINDFLPMLAERILEINLLEVNDDSAELAVRIWVAMVQDWTSTRLERYKP